MTAVQVAENEWELPRSGAMRVPGRVFASAQRFESLRDDACLEQVANVACLPGIVGASIALPDVHRGHGFPIGAVAAFDPREGGVIAPAGVGLDIHCGVRLLVVRGVRPKKAREHRGELAKALLLAVPAGAGRDGELKLKAHELDQVARQGAAWAVARGYGEPEDLERVEERGAASWAEPRHVSADARIRGAPQLGTLGSGGHFLEVQTVAEVFDEDAARALGLTLGGLTAMIHTGSRGFGHQVCEDFLARMQATQRRQGIELPERALRCAPFDSDEGQAFFGALGSAVNFALANRQVITQRVRAVLRAAFGADVEAEVVCDLGHNGARLERHLVDGVERELLVHRRGATRTLGPGHPELPAPYRALGQPVLVPGGVGRHSYVLLGTPTAASRTFASCSHGAGRLLDRTEARAAARGRDLTRELARQGISLQASRRATVEEEIGAANRDVTDTLEIVTRAGLARPVAKLAPFVVVKG